VLTVVEVVGGVVGLRPCLAVTRGGSAGGDGVVEPVDSVGVSEVVVSGVVVSGVVVGSVHACGVSGG
jgi:hypothetical protein